MHLTARTTDSHLHSASQLVASVPQLAVRTRLDGGHPLGRQLRAFCYDAKLKEGIVLDVKRIVILMNGGTGQRNNFVQLCISVTCIAENSISLKHSPPQLRVDL